MPQPFHTSYRENNTHCVKTSETFTCPFSFALFSELIDRPGGRDRSAIIGNNVRVYAQPSTKSPTIATLSNEAIKLAENNPNLPFVNSLVKVLLPSGKTGYVSHRYIYTRFGYRAIFQKLDGKWQMTDLLSVTSRFSKIGKHFSSNNLVIRAAIVENQTKHNRLW